MERSLQPILQHYFSEEHSQVIICLVKTLDDASHDNFHDLRVRLKRIRFLKGLLNQQELLRGKKSFRPYDTLFRQAGRIREYQVHAFLLEKFGVEYRDESYPKHFRKKEKQLIRKWKKGAMKLLQIIVLRYTRIQHILLKWEQSIPNFTGHLKQNLEATFGVSIPDDQLHQSRKFLKAVLYSTELDPFVKRQINRFCRIHVAEQLEDAIGDWHDMYVLLHEHPEEEVNSRLRMEMQRERKKIDRLIPKLLRQQPEKPVV